LHVHSRIALLKWCVYEVLISIKTLSVAFQ
jgi:hypothetical protein